LSPTRQIAEIRKLVLETSHSNVKDEKAIETFLLKDGRLVQKRIQNSIANVLIEKNSDAYTDLENPNHETTSSETVANSSRKGLVFAQAGKMRSPLNRSRDSRRSDNPTTTWAVFRVFTITRC